jgi:5-methyltetrahydrofolate--homocysteine methyltransferase
MRELKSGAEESNKGTVTIATVHGDLHDIGKNFVTFVLDISGYKVADLDIDVLVDTVIDALKQHQPPAVGLSGFLTLGFDSMKETIEAIQNTGLCKHIKIMIGGRLVVWGLDRRRRLDSASARHPDQRRGECAR